MRRIKPLIFVRNYYETPEKVYGCRVVKQSIKPDHKSLGLVECFRKLGHFYAHTNPLKEPESFPVNLDKNDLKSTAWAASQNVESVVQKLKKEYTGSIGYEFEHLDCESEKEWFRERIEQWDPEINERRIHGFLARSEVLDHFLAKKFPSVKRYGLEGAESMIVAVDALFQNCNTRNIVMCMPHRGRLNLLVDILGFEYKALFSKMQGNQEFNRDYKHCTGDVLSHLSCGKMLESGVHVSLVHNPSHLEAAVCVAAGKARSRSEKSSTLCLQIHGDAAFSGQGVIMETLLLSQLPHYTCGGSIHVIVNNQLGFTTPTTHARSSLYASDVSKMISCPVIHVNAQDPEKVFKASLVASEYQKSFAKDVVIDLIGYRRWGHNELDEPLFTQPAMYKKIRNLDSIPKTYESVLATKKLLSAKESESIRETHRQKLEDDFSNASSYVPPKKYLKGAWNGMVPPDGTDPQTKVEKEDLVEEAKQSVSIPNDFNVHPRLQKLHMKARLDKINEFNFIDWATAEAMAIGTLLREGFNVRFSGQDVGRGTFSHRHAMLVDQKTGEVCIPLNKKEESRGKLEVCNSPLSEFAVLGFEYGYSIEDPKTLVIWEAQFGDFYNGAQIIVDNFVSCSDAKWLRQSGLVMLLPHGYDGAGPEHSSCRLERFLQLYCAESHNMSIVYPTTPAQYFHVLRRQMKRPYRAPLIVVSPKTILRLPAAVDNLSAFQNSFDKIKINGPESPKLVVLCTGKIYYDLYQKKPDSVSLVRIEELAPFPKEVIEYLESVNAKSVVWCQEEPQNQGAYNYIFQILSPKFNVRYVGRKAMAACASGVSSTHQAEQEEIIAKAFE